MAFVNYPLVTREVARVESERAGFVPSGATR